MTGYAAGTTELPGASLHLEIRSVNSRFLDLGFRCHDELRFLEMPLREKIAAAVGRGKVECRMNLSMQAGSSRELAPNANLVAQLARLEGVVRAALPAAAPLTVAEVLRWPGVISDETIDPEKLQAAALALADEAIKDFLATRAREGEKLAAMILERAARMRELTAQVGPLLPGAIGDYESRLSTKLRDAVANLDEERIRQEVGLFAARVDVAEELSRLSTHLDELERIIKKGGAVGKRLDFLMQELNREANTLASKSVSTDITAIALELKLLIEQVREQVQNLE
jgi:uncharacterized protein (TIGR00255 family)